MTNMLGYLFVSKYSHPDERVGEEWEQAIRGKLPAKLAEDERVRDFVLDHLIYKVGQTVQVTKASRRGRTVTMSAYRAVILSISPDMTCVVKPEGKGKAKKVPLGVIRTVDEPTALTEFVEAVFGRNMKDELNNKF